MNNLYLILKTIHVFGVIIFLGNLIVTGWWKVMADRTRDPRIVAFAQRQVIVTDYLFTLTGVVIITLTGIGNAQIHHLDYLTIPWMAWPFWSFAISGLIWFAILIPLQRKQAQMAREFATAAVIPSEYWRLTKLWNGWGIVATLLPLAAVVWMVMKFD